MKLLVAAVAAAALGALGACGTPPPEWSVDAGACEAYEVSPTLNLMMPTRSFSTDVLPLFTAHCDNCHGTSSSPSGGVFLGKTSGDADAVFTNLVGMPSGEYAGMPFITAGDPTRSYLMHKLDGDQCLYDKMCDGGSCERGMPMSGGALDETERDTIRQWIAQGAMQN